MLALLQERGTVECTIASNGAFALEAVKNENFDLIFMDIHMPVMDGLEALKAMKKMGIETPIVTLTGNNLDWDKENYLLNGFHDCLSKPIEHQELTKILHTYLEKDISQSKHINVANAIEELGISPTYYLKLLHQLFPEIKKDLLHMLDALRREDCNDLHMIAHKLKGVTANLRLPAITLVAENIDKNAKNNTKEYPYKKDILSIFNTLSELQNSD